MRPLFFITTFTTVEFKKLLSMKLTSEIINILNAGGLKIGLDKTALGAGNVRLLGC